MNIIFYAPGMPPCKYGGAEMLNQSIVSILSKNHRVALITSCNIPDDKYKLVYQKVIKPNRLTIPLRIFYYLTRNIRKADVVHLTYAQHNQLLWMLFPFLKWFINYKYVLYIVDGGLKPYIPFAYRWCLKIAKSKSSHSSGGA